MVSTSSRTSRVRVDILLAPYVSWRGHPKLQAPYCVREVKLKVFREISSTAGFELGGCRSYLHQQQWRGKSRTRYAIAAVRDTGLFLVFEFAKVHVGFPL